MNDGLIIDLYFERNETAFFAYLAKIIRNLSFNMYKKDRTQKRNAVIVELSSEMEQCIPAPDDFKMQVKPRRIFKHDEWFFIWVKRNSLHNILASILVL